ncbi:DUF3168 domain-containing protein [Hoeflea sp. WL0058]|uniref:DUF3168 domain-containing protein n=1 Tax=Flavimaribacter sediminis TaxID=2865987 RepID=A0AAE2ZMM0_9HYPH|nr:DUF3168 domain-containing protein [Flavimaribacter sediminis]MBW8638996.1 DUF3168 domain-containing protein [Flavimaribacter sediminis]
MNVPDIIAAMVALLKADSGVTALVGLRVFGLELPREEVDDMPRKGVILRPSGGVSAQGGYLELTADRIDAISWGETPYQASIVSLAVLVALKRLRRRVISGVLIHSAEEAGGRLPIRDAETDWPAMTQAFQVLYALKAAA